MLERLLRVAQLDRTVFAEIEHDESLTSEAAIIVVAANFLAALGSGFASPRFFGAFIGTLISGVLFGWLLWSFLTMWIGTNIFEGDADLGEMLRVIGYASAPRLLGLFGFIPCVGWILSLAGAILSLVAAFFAIQEGLDLDTPKTLATVAIGWVISFVLTLLVGILTGGTMAALGSFG